MQFQLLRPNDPQWQVLFESLPRSQQDVSYSPSFARLCQRTLNRDDEVFCAAMTSDANVILYPFVRRNVGRLTKRSDFAELYDITSMYGRGGIATSDREEAGIAFFHEQLAVYCRETAVACGFDRYHPILGNDALVPPQASVMDVGGFVVVDMRPKMSDIEASFKPSVRKDLRKAESNGITCFAESDCSHLGEFLEIYNHTMNRNSAADFYYFSDEFFSVLSKEMIGKFHYFYAMVDGEIVSCELVLRHGIYAHSFLGGTKRDSLPLCANPMLKREIIRFLKDQGSEYFLLGGGTRPDDGIFKFKKAYAPTGVFPSRIGGTVWDHQSYARLKHEMSSTGVAISSSRFQFYDRSQA